MFIISYTITIWNIIILWIYTIVLSHLSNDLIQIYNILNFNNKTSIEKFDLTKMNLSKIKGCVKLE